MFCNLEMTINMRRCAKNAGPQGRKQREAFADVWRWVKPRALAAALWQGDLRAWTLPAGGVFRTALQPDARRRYCRPASPPNRPAPALARDSRRPISGGGERDRRGAGTRAASWDSGGCRHCGCENRRGQSLWARETARSPPSGKLQPPQDSDCGEEERSRPEPRAPRRGGLKTEQRRLWPDPKAGFPHPSPDPLPGISHPWALSPPGQGRLRPLLHYLPEEPNI